MRSDFLNLNQSTRNVTADSFVFRQINPQIRNAEGSLGILHYDWGKPSISKRLPKVEHMCLKNTINTRPEGILLTLWNFGAAEGLGSKKI